MTDTARHDALVQSDERARHAAQEVFDRPLLLEAGAGTGKTTALVARVLAWAAGPGWQRAEAELAAAASASGRSGPLEPDRIAAQTLGRVVAITFTEAAAAEMSLRIAEALRDLERGELPLGLFDEVLPTDRAERALRARALHGCLDHLVVQTIHAYCRRLLAAHPLEAGLHPHLEVDADLRVQSEVVRDVLAARTAIDRSDDLTRALVALTLRGDGLLRLEEQLLACLAAGLAAHHLAEDPFTAARVGALGARVEAAVDAFFAAGAAGLRGAKTGARTQEVLSCIDAVRAQFNDRRGRLGDDTEALAALRECIDHAAEHFGDVERNRLRDWARGHFLVGETAALADAAAPVARAAATLSTLIAHISTLDVDGLELARPLFEDLLAEIQGELRSRGIATFEALLVGARNLLCDQPDVARRVRTGIDQLLVDEFQDTDRDQCDIVRAIALTGPREERPGLLLVGDPKQSIYGWRNADLAAYDAFAEGVLAEGGIRERLSVNYRSVPAILDEVERAIEPIMREAKGLQPGFQPLVPSPANTSLAGFEAGGRSAVEYWVSASWDAGAEAFAPLPVAAAAQLEARALANDLRDLHEQHGVEWGAIGVLFRSRTDWEIYLSALRDVGIPFAVEGDRNYYQRREVIDAAALVRCVLDPNDHLALLTWLRSTAVGVPDAALIPLWTRGFPARAGALFGAADPELTALADDIHEVAASLPEDVPGLARIAGWERNLVAAVDALAQLRGSFASEPGDRFVEALRTTTLFEASEAARYLGAWRSANLERFFRELAVDLAEGGAAGAVLRRLRRAIATRERAPEARPDESVDDSVSIMTVHGAKGLDFDHVYFVQLHKGSDTIGSQDSCAGQSATGIEYRLLDAATPGFDEVASAARAVSAAERVRLLYVAMTRAKQRLVLAGLWPEFQQRRTAGQTLELLAERALALPPLSEWMGELAARGIDRGVDEFGATWVFPGLQPADALEAAEAPCFDVAIPAPAEIESSARTLAAARLDASARMLRPVSSRASDAGREADAEARAERRMGPASTGASPDPQTRGEPEAASRVARHVGTAIHRVLELGDLSLPPDELRAEAAPTLEASLSEELGGEDLETALGVGRALLDDIARGPLIARLRDLASDIVARELPVLLPAAAAAVESDATPAPVGFVAGAIDLVYRDPESGELVVADYKTDQLGPDADGAALRAVAAKYAGQGDLYRRALREALELPYTPRFELWLLAHGRSVVVDAPPV